MNRQPNDDLFEESRMSFGEHLEELRVVLFRCVIGLAIGMVVGLYFTKDVVNFLQWPVEEAITDFRLDVARQKIVDQYGYVPPEKEFLLTEHRKIPINYQIHPAEIYSMLKEFRPSSFPGEFDPLDFSGRNLPLSTITKVANSLVDGEVAKADFKSDDDVRLFSPAAEHLSTLISESERKAIEEIGKKELDQVTAADQVLILKALNRLSTDVQWFDHESLEKAYAAKEPSWLVKTWNDFWQLKSNDPDNAFGKLKNSLLENPDKKVQKRLQRSVLQKIFLVTLNDSEYRELELWSPVRASTQALGTSEAFMIYLKAVVLVGMVVAGPYLFYQIWTFVAAGLYPSERKYVYIYLPFSLILFFAGVSVAFLFAFKPVLNFLFSFNAELGIDPQPQIGQWLSFVLFVPLGFGIGVPASNRYDAALSDWRDFLKDVYFSVAIGNFDYRCIIDGPDTCRSDQYGSFRWSTDPAIWTGCGVVLAIPKAV